MYGCHNISTRWKEYNAQQSSSHSIWATRIEFKFCYFIFLYLYKLFVEEAGALNDENVGLDKINDGRPINNSYQLINVDNHERSFQSSELHDKGLELCDKGAPEVSDKTINIHDFVSNIMTRKLKSTYQREWYKN